MSVPQLIDQSNYAVERSEACAIDTELAAPADADGWVRHFRARAERAEQALVVQVERAQEQEAQWIKAVQARDEQNQQLFSENDCLQLNRDEWKQEAERLQALVNDMEVYWQRHQADLAELNQGCSWLASQLRYEEADNNANQIDYLDMDQGCADLARRAQTAEEQLLTLLSLTTDNAYLLQNALKRLANEERSHGTTKRLLADLQAEADDLCNRLAASAEQHVSDLAIMGDAYDALSVAHTEAIDILGRVAHCLVEHIDIGPALTKQIMTIITKEATP